MSSPPPVAGAGAGAATATGGDAATTAAASMARRCQFFLPNKRRLCSNPSLPFSRFCGNHDPATDASRVPCPVDPSHTVMRDNLESHVKKCPLRTRAERLESQPYYVKGVNDGEDSDEHASSEVKRNAVYRLTVQEFWELVRKIEMIRSSVEGVLADSYIVPDVCEKWLKQQPDRQVPYQEKHAKQQASILGNLEAFGVLGKTDEERHEGDVGVPAVVELGAGRGYLTHMLADCYRITKVVLVERRSYKFKADRDLRKIQAMSLERLRIDIKDLNLQAVESLKGLRYLAIGKHLCGPATDLAIRCCLPEEHNQHKGALPSYLQGLGLATCCHHLCQWSNYINRSFLLKWGITKEDFNAITWFSSWAVDADHSSDLSNAADGEICLTRDTPTESGDSKAIEETIRNMEPVERAVIGFLCKEIIDVGRLLWLREHGLDAQLVKYVPSIISPENHLLVAALKPHTNKFISFTLKP